MNDTLGRIDRSEDIFRALQQIATYLETRAVDVMLVAGDLFCDRSRPDQTREAIARLRQIFGPFLARGGSIVAISGNHDSEILFETLRDASHLFAPPQGCDEGRLHLAPNPRMLKLSDRAGQQVQFVLMPYPSARCYLRGHDIEYSTVADRNRLVQKHFVQTLNDLRLKIDTALPSVLVSHIHVRGARTHNLFRVTEAEDVMFDATHIPTEWAYVAYGHIHEAQTAGAGLNHVRYCGSVECLDAGEANDKKGVLLFDIDAQGLCSDVETLPLSSTRLHQIEITDPDEVATLRERFPDAENALVHYTLHWTPGLHNRDEIAREIGRIFPRWYKRDFVQNGANSLAIKGETLHLSHVADNVRHYLNASLSENPQRAAVLELAESLLAETNANASANISANENVGGVA